MSSGAPGGLSKSRFPEQRRTQTEGGGRRRAARAPGHRRRRPLPHGPGLQGARLSPVFTPPPLPLFPFPFPAGSSWPSPHQADGEAEVRGERRVGGTGAWLSSIRPPSSPSLCSRLHPGPALSSMPSFFFSFSHHDLRYQPNFYGSWSSTCKLIKEQN